MLQNHLSLDTVDSFIVSTGLDQAKSESRQVVITGTEQILRLASNAYNSTFSFTRIDYMLKLLYNTVVCRMFLKDHDSTAEYRLPALWCNTTM